MANFCNDKNNNGSILCFFRATKTKSPTGHLGATKLPPIGDSLLYIETSSNNYDNDVFVSWEITDIIQSTNVTFFITVTQF